jgi:hypothetical protein
VQSCLFLNIKNQSIFEIIKFIIIGTWKPALKTDNNKWSKVQTKQDFQRGKKIIYNKWFDEVLTSPEKQSSVFCVCFWEAFWWQSWRDRKGSTTLNIWGTPPYPLALLACFLPSSLASLFCLLPLYSVQNKFRNPHTIMAEIHTHTHTHTHMYKKNEPQKCSYKRLVS